MTSVPDKPSGGNDGNGADHISTPADASKSLLIAALAYAARGWRVVPLYHIRADGSCSCGDEECGSPGKHPRTRHGLKDGTTDADIIRGWWKKWPMANIGVCTGPESGLWMFGPDGQAGIDALAELEQTHGQLPTTTTARSGSGGRHHLFRWPSSGSIGNRKNHRGRPIDVRGRGGYFVAAPSVNGNGPYAWELGPDERALADAPDWLLAWCEKEEKPPPPPQLPPHLSRSTADGRKSIVERALAYLATMPGAISGQRGHDRLMDAARVVVYGFDLGPETGYQILAEHYNRRCDPLWTEKELRHKCAEADTVPFGKSRGWLLEQSTWRRPRQNRQGGTSQGLPPPDAGRDRSDAGEPIEVHLTDLGNARRMVRRHGKALRHCQPWKKWLCWDGHQWRIDDTLATTRCAKHVSAELYKWAQKEIAEVANQGGSDD
jgi:hypothetical protein